MPASLKCSFIISSLWLLLGFFLYWSGGILIISFNMFSWSPELKQSSLILALFVFLILFGIFILSRHTKGKFERWLSFVVVSSLALMGGILLTEYYNETVSFLRSQLSPHWFRISTSGIFFIPLFFHLYFINIFKKPKK